MPRAHFAPSLDGRRFIDVSDRRDGDVGAETLFEYHQEADGVVWARYSGGAVRLGHLVGRRTGDTLDFRYAHLTTDGSTASGHCTSHVTVRPDGVLELDEVWEWESRSGSGRSLLRELTQ